mgnify:CR=1 FL=1|jgi:uncharacterized membrane protein
MDARSRNLLGAGIVAVTGILGIAVMGRLPDQVAIQFGPSGQPDDYAGKAFALALVPGLQAVMLAVFAVLPRIDPLGENIRKFGDMYNWLVVVIVGFLGYVHGTVLLWNVGYEFAVTQAVVPAVAVLYYFIGVVMERAEQNWFVGIRTPWTLSNEQVWQDTHALGGTLFKIAAAIALGGLVLPQYAVVLIAGPAALLAVITTVYSYWDYRRVTQEA